jgi:hypothetical protein
VIPLSIEPDAGLRLFTIAQACGAPGMHCLTCNRESPPRLPAGWKSYARVAGKRGNRRTMKCNGCERRRN